MKLLLIFGLVSFVCHAEEATMMVEVTVHFSPRGGAEAEVVRQIAAARSQVRLEGYSFTSKPIIAALIAAKARGVDVEVILDKRWNTTTPAGKDALSAAGVPVLLDGKHPIMHDKVVVIDAATVLAGSFNFTGQADHYNAENLPTMRNSELAALYLRDWETHAAHSVENPTTTTPK